MTETRRDNLALSVRTQLAIVLALVVAVLSAAVIKTGSNEQARERPTDLSSRSRTESRLFKPTQAQWTSLRLQPVQLESFRAAVVTEGKVAIDENGSTPIFSPYTGRVIRLFAKPGDIIERGQRLFVIEGADMVQSQNDFVAALNALNKSQSQLKLTQTNEKRQHDLYEGKAVPLKDWQQAHADLAATTSDTQAAEATVDATRKRLRILGRTEGEITEIAEKHAISSDIPILSPITGIVLQRKIGPGQYVNNGSSDPAFIVGDVSTVWLVANVREADTSKVAVGQPIEVRTLSFPDRIFTGKIDYVAPAIDSATRRILVRGTVDNPGRLLKPEMFATVTVVIGDDEISPAVPREAIVYHGDRTHVWCLSDNDKLRRHEIRLGLSNGNSVQVVSGLNVNDKVVVQGGLLVDRAMATDEF